MVLSSNKKANLALNLALALFAPVVTVQVGNTELTLRVVRYRLALLYLISFLLSVPP